jgi:hypothetical protein
MADPRRSPLVDCVLAGAIGGVLLLVVGWCWPAATVPFPGHGARFVAMAEAPLAFDGEIPQRVLWPLLAWLVGKVGIGPLACSQLCSWFLLAVVVWFARSRAPAWADAALVGAAVAASGAVLLYQQPMACLSDSLVLALLVLAVHHAARPAVFWALVATAALAHELVFHLAPWLWWLRCRSGGVWWRDGLWFAGLFAGYALYRVWVSSQVPVAAPQYGFLYYLLHNVWVPWLLPSLWALWLVTALAEFGPLLVLAVAACRSGEAGLGGRWGGPLYVACVATMMVLAYDVMRFATLLVVPVLCGALALVRLRQGRAVLAACVVASAVSYACQHPVPTDQGGATFTRVAGELMARAAPHMAQQERVPFDIAWAVQRDGFAAAGGTWAVVAVGWVVVLGLGWWVGTRMRRAPATETA